MTYATSGLIQATDYNNFAGGAAANVSGQLNTVLSTGRGNAGYGQTAVANVSVAGTVTATQWSTLLSGINKVRQHQSLTGFTNVALATAGTTINAGVNIASNLAAAYTNRLSTVYLGPTVTGTVANTSLSIPNQTAAATLSFTKTATFASADAARYFFNAGGSLNFVIASATNTGGTQRGLSICNIALTHFKSKTIRSGSCDAHTGTGGTVNVDQTTNYGYYGQTTANVNLCQITGSDYAAYNSDYIIFYGKTNGAQGTNADNGTVLSLSVDLVSAAQSPAFNDSFNVTIGHRIDVTYPETTFLANTWGSVTIA